MTALSNRPVTFINAQMRGGQSSLRTVDSNIVAVGGAPKPHDIVIDLAGDRLLPGLINSHDHLQLNHFPRLKYRDHYRNVVEWIDDIRPRLIADPILKACQMIPRDERLLLGGVKNLLSGVTTVAHHDQLYDSLLDPAFPVRVVAQFGWSHSLSMDGEPGVANAYRKTPNDWPWIIHAAEGIDAPASAEFDRLKSLGCLKDNTLIVHGVALDARQQRELGAAGAGLIWCPTSNQHLFGRTADVAELVSEGRLALGTDSRLSGDQDILAEIRAARAASGIDAALLESMVTTDSARLLRLRDRGSLTVGAAADLIVLPRAMELTAASRKDIRLVMIDGKPRYGDEMYASAFAPRSAWASLRVDGALKVMERSLGRRIARASVQEAGLDLSGVLEEAA